MGKDKLDALVRIGNLKVEQADAEEVESLVRSGKNRLDDAENSDLNIESRFELAYSASHSIALAALRNSGYRSSKRYLVFQCLEHTLGIPPEEWRVLDNAHKKRNNAAYEGVFDVSEELIVSIIKVTQQLLSKLEA